MKKLLFCIVLLFSNNAAFAGAKLYVGNLAYSVTEADLKDLFGQYGTVLSANIIIDRDTGRPKGFAFVEMETPAQAQAAIDALNGKEYDGRPLTVTEARPKSDLPRRAGEYQPPYGGGGGRRATH